MSTIGDNDPRICDLRLGMKHGRGEYVEMVARITKPWVLTADREVPGVEILVVEYCNPLCALGLNSCLYLHLTLV